MLVASLRILRQVGAHAQPGQVHLRLVNGPRIQALTQMATFVRTNEALANPGCGDRRQNPTTTGAPTLLTTAVATLETRS